MLPVCLPTNHIPLLVPVGTLYRVVMLAGANHSALLGSKLRGESKTESSPFLKERYKYIRILEVLTVMDGNTGSIPTFSDSLHKRLVQGWHRPDIDTLSHCT